ncbi:MAG TPA: hypothetical protein VIX73_21835, partial [Kofleriaceae bacterium]
MARYAEKLSRRAHDDHDHEDEHERARMARRDRPPRDRADEAVPGRRTLVQEHYGDEHDDRDLGAMANGATMSSPRPHAAWIQRAIGHGEREAARPTVRELFGSQLPPRG